MAARRPSRRPNAPVPPPEPPPAPGARVRRRPMDPDAPQLLFATLDALDAEAEDLDAQLQGGAVPDMGALYPGLARLLEQADVLSAPPVVAEWSALVEQAYAVGDRYLELTEDADEAPATVAARSLVDHAISTARAQDARNGIRPLSLDEVARAAHYSVYAVGIQERVQLFLSRLEAMIPRLEAALGTPPTPSAPRRVSSRPRVAMDPGRCWAACRQLRDLREELRGLQGHVRVLAQVFDIFGRHTGDEM